jgi:hypothetical protein
MQEGVEPGSPGFAKAVPCLRVAVGAKPDFASAHSLRGKPYVQSEDYLQAVEQLRLAAKYDPSDRMAFSQLAIELRRLGRNDEASTAQKFNFNASWSVRGEFCVPVMTPKLVDPTVTLGSAKMGVLVTLNASPRI